MSAVPASILLYTFIAWCSNSLTEHYTCNSRTSYWRLSARLGFTIKDLNSQQVITAFERCDVLQYARDLRKNENVSFARHVIHCDIFFSSIQQQTAGLIGSHNQVAPGLNHLSQHPQGGLPPSPQQSQPPTPPSSYVSIRNT